MRPTGEDGRREEAAVPDEAAVPEREVLDHPVVEEPVLRDVREGLLGDQDEQDARAGDAHEEDLDGEARQDLGVEVTACTLAADVEDREEAPERDERPEGVDLRRVLGRRRAEEEVRDDEVARARARDERDRRDEREPLGGPLLFLERHPVRDRPEERDKGSEDRGVLRDELHEDGMQASTPWEETEYHTERHL
jgi:hypothetical protein